MLAERYGIPMPKRTDYADAESKLRGALLDMHAIAAQMFQENLRGPQGAEARELSRPSAASGRNRSIRSSWAIPNRPGRRFAGACEKQFSQEQMEASGLVRKAEDGSRLLRFLSRPADVSDPQ